MPKINEWFDSRKRVDPVTQAYDFIESGIFPGQVRQTEDDTELTPYDQPYRLENWDHDDLVMYCGGAYAKEAYSK